MSTQIIGTTIAGTIAKATGRGHQGHLQWATNDSAWWLFYTSSSNTTHLLTYRSPNGVTWTAKTALTFGFSDIQNNNAENFSVTYKNISSNDVFHEDFWHSTSGNFNHCRATTSVASISWGTDDNIGSDISATGSINSTISSDNFPYIGEGAEATVATGKGNNADLGSSWSSGITFGGTGFDTPGAICLLPTSTNRVQFICDNANGGTSFTELDSRTWDGTTLGTALVIATGIGSQDSNDWSAARVSNTDIHIVYRTGSNTFSHKRWNGTNWTSVGGAAIPNLSNVAGSGIALVSNGTNVWMFLIGSDANNTVSWIKWTAISNTWSATWTALESSNKVRNYIACSPNLDSSTSANIGIIWTQTNGSNFDIVFSNLNTISAPSGPFAGDEGGVMYYDRVTW